MLPPVHSAPLSVPTRPPSRAKWCDSRGVVHVWQRNYYEHIIRNADEWKRIHSYVEANPLGWDKDEENPANI